MRTIPRRVLGGLLGIGVVTTAAAPAHASNMFDSYFLAAVAITVIPDVTFATYDIVVASKGELPSSGWSIAETITTVPQTLLFNPMYAAVQDNDDGKDSLQVLLLVPAAGSAILSTHGIWSAATVNVRPAVLAGSSIAVGVNAALSTGVLANAVNGRFSGRAVGFAGMLLTAPQIAVGSYLSATSPSSNRAGWIGLTAWSGTLFLHGLVSMIRGHESHKVEPAPPVPPPPPLLQQPPPFVPNERPTLLVPASIRVGPTVVSDGVASAPGIGISGVLF